jgi:pimeloyl-ACP methyl ester carboxylesterase
MPNHESVTKLLLVVSLFIAFAFLLIIPSTTILSSNNSYFGTTNIVYGQSDQINSNVTNSLNIQNIPVKKVHVRDIDIAYKMFGKGEPILLIGGTGSNMNAWLPYILGNLSSNHTVITSDYRGVGNTTIGTKPFSIQQFANDTVGLLDALKIQKVDVLGFSMGSLVAQQLAVTHPEKVNRLILIAASCGGKEGIPQSAQLVKLQMKLVNSFANNTPIDPQDIKTVLFLQYGPTWMKLHPNILETVPIPKLKDLFSGVTPNVNLQQFNAIRNWFATNWSGICDKLPNLSKPTLVVTGTEDVNVPTANSLIIAGKIPGAWLIQIKDAGHALFGQYPDKVNKVLQTFLSTTSNPG